MKHKLLLVGSGAWGQKYISTLSDFSTVSLEVATRDNWKKLIDNKPDGVIVCTPPQSHVEIASYALTKDIPTMIEKPLSLSLLDAKLLQQFSAPILVNHIHLFADSYQALKQSLFGKNISSIYSVGVNQGPYRDYTSLWDYGPHDLSMILDLLGEFPKKISAIERKCGHGSLYSIVMSFDYCHTFTTVGNGAGAKQRNLSVVVGDAILKYEDKNISPPLTSALRVFIDAICGKSDYRLGLDLSLQIIDLLEKCCI